jgi:hypothetical protein
VKGFDFHAVILATDETQMKHGFFSRGATPGKIGADNAAKRARLDDSQTT